MRKIIHVDCDCFYAAVEMRDFPKLVGRPVAVGGHSKRRGVLATCNYEARAYGLHAAMPTAEAFKRCAHLQLMPARFEVYKEVSSQMHEIFREYTLLIEPLSLDEAFLDVSDCTLLEGSATYIAQEIRQKIKQRLGITASAGIATNKFLAKIASDWEKPNGQTVILPCEVSDFVKALPLKKIPGVGQVTLRKMNRLGLESCADLQAWSEEDVLNQFGKFGVRLLDYRFGLDDRAVVTSRQRKSLSVERTFDVNLYGKENYLASLQGLHEELLQRIRKLSVKSLSGVFTERKSKKVTRLKYSAVAATRLPLFSFSIRSLQLKVKLSDFSVHTREAAFSCDLLEVQQLLSFDAFKQLLDKYLEHYAQEGDGLPSIRLLGVGVNFKWEKDSAAVCESSPLYRSKESESFDNEDRRVQQLNLF